MKTDTFTKIVVAVFAVLMLGAAVSWADTPAAALASQEKGIGKIEGVVKDAKTGAALQDVYVCVEGCLDAAMTNERGQFFIRQAPSGSCVLKATKRGYKPIELQVQVEKKKTSSFTVELKPAPKPVPVEEES